jgi:hypothetical protein
MRAVGGLLKSWRIQDRLVDYRILHRVFPWNKRIVRVQGGVYVFSALRPVKTGTFSHFACGCPCCKTFAAAPLPSLVVSLEVIYIPMSPEVATSFP